jgi:ribosomal-protein-alanine N-acetyltransferase
MFCALETKRLYLKTIDSSDVEFIFNQFSNEFINTYLFDAEPLTSIEEAHNIIDFYCVPEPRAQHRWIIILKETNEKIGTCGFHCWDRESNTCEMGYDLLEKYNGHGYMSEAIDEIIKFSMESMHISRIDAHIYHENIKSIKLAEKNGFRKNGEKVYRYRENDYNHFIFSLFMNAED